MTVMNVSAVRFFKSNENDPPYYWCWQIAYWFFWALISFSAYLNEKSLSDNHTDHIVCNLISVSFSLFLTHCFLRPVYWWLSRLSWSCSKKIVGFLVAAHLCVWAICGVYKVTFYFLVSPSSALEDASFVMMFVFQIVLILWGFIYHDWTWKTVRQDRIELENPIYYVLCQVAIWFVFVGFWYTLFLSKEGFENNYGDFFKLWMQLYVCIGILISHGVLRTYCRRLITLGLGPIGKVILSFAVLFLCVLLGLLIDLACITWATVEIPPRSPVEVLISIFIRYVIFVIWMLGYMAWLNWQQKQSELTRRLQLEASFRDAQLSGLKQQLNPHFIFNTLNSLRALIVKDPQVARKMVTGISNVLRYSLYESEKNVVPLEQEVEIVKDYLQIELLRYDSRIELTWDIDEPLLSIMVIPLCLQTLVENAIKHTINQYSEGIFIHIEAQIREESLHIIVENKGRIIPSERSGIGLKNTTERLALIFGDQASLSLTQKQEEVVQAKIIIPLSGSISKPSEEKPPTGDAV